jgi:hypothetical protein
MSFAKLVVNHVPLILSKPSFVLVQKHANIAAFRVMNHVNVEAKLKYLYLSSSHFTERETVGTEFTVMSHLNLKAFTFSLVRLVAYLIFELEFRPDRTVDCMCYNQKH